MLKLDRFKCIFTNHTLLPQKYTHYDFGNGMSSWVQECKCCKKIIFCVQVNIKKQLSDITKIPLDSTTIDDVKKYPYNLIKQI